MGQPSSDDLWKNMPPLKVANLALHFLLELCAFAALLWWGFQTGQGVFMQLVLGIGVAVIAAGVWGIFRVPGEPGNATVPVSRPVRLVIEWVILALAVAGLFATGHTMLALFFAVVIVVDYIGLYASGIRKM